MSDIDVLVAGGGLAGLTAALQAARLGHRVTVLTGHVTGGLLVSIESVQGLPGHPDGIPGYDLCPMTLEQALDAGAQSVAGEATALRRDGDAWRVDTADGTLAARAVIVASGSRLKALGVPGEERLRDKGVSHCASCDAPLLRGRTVAVVGGGDAACQESLTLAAHAAQVHLLHRGDALRAQASWRQRVAAQPKIVLRPHSEVTEILGESEVTALGLRDQRSGDAGELAVNAVFVYVGLAPNSEFLAGAHALDGAGRLVVDAQLCCAAPGLFAAGSVRAGHDGQAVGAAADGVRAAFAAHRFLE